MYRPTLAERAFETALGLEDLSPDVRPALEALQAQYAADVASLNERILMQMQKQEPQDLVEDATRFMSILNGEFPMGGMGGGLFGRGGGPFGGGGEPGPLQDLMSRRGEISDAYVRRIRDLLTPEQQAKLPQRGRGGGRGAGGPMAGGFGGALGDGRLADMPEPIRDRVRPYDTNNDGVLDDSERRAAMEALRQQWGRGGMGFGSGDAGEAPPPRRSSRDAP